jgi:predicted DNA-binding transcriptional regulator AlpA
MDTTPASAPLGQTVLRYPDVAAAYRVSRRTVERWVEQSTAPPFYRDPSGRPYWLKHELAEFIEQRPTKRIATLPQCTDDRLEQLRRASARGSRRT